MQKNEKSVVLFHNIRNLDVKLQLGHPLPLQTLDLTMISINSYWVGKIHQHQICIGFPRWWSIQLELCIQQRVDQLNFEDQYPGKMLCLDNGRSYLCVHIVIQYVIVHLIEIKFHQPALFNYFTQKYHSKNQNIRLCNDLLILHIKHIKQKQSKSIVWMFNWWTCVISVSCIWRIRCHN